MKKIKEVVMQRVSPIRKRPLPEVQDRSRTKRNRKLFCISQKRKMRAAMMAPALPHIRVELYAEQKKEVTAIRCYHTEETGYPICPNCGYAMEREFQKFCEQCGQLLSWRRFIGGKITVQRIRGSGILKESFLKPNNLSQSVSAPASLKRNSSKMTCALNAFVKDSQQGNDDATKL
jgi:hypothetical protein